MVLHVRDTQEYPNGWAKLVSELINRPGWNRTRLAREAGINRNTVRRWIDGESSNISASSIRLIADAAGIDYQTAAEAAVGARAQDIRNDDDAIRIIDESDLPADIKDELKDMVRSRRLESEESLRRDIEAELGRLSRTRRNVS
jgi:transcriptional regulator with XRE-family HTH domain